MFSGTEKNCCHQLISLKLIDSHTYCRMGQELYNTTCKGKDCKHIFVCNENRNSVIDTNKVEYLPTSKRYVKACFNVNGDYKIKNLADPPFIPYKLTKKGYNDFMPSTFHYTYVN